jgi:uncharacterized protein YlxW (UPF0749 family)
MKAKYLIWIMDSVEFLRRWGKFILAAVLIIVVAWSYLSATKEIRQTSKKVEKIQEQVQDLDAARINLNAALEKMQIQETIIIENRVNEKIKILRLDPSELQHYADSLYNARR